MPLHFWFYQAQGFVTVDEVERHLSWTSGRAIDVLDILLEVSCCCHWPKLLLIHRSQILGAQKFYIGQCRKVLQWQMMAIEIENAGIGSLVYLPFHRRWGPILNNVFSFSNMSSLYPFPYGTWNSGIVKGSLLANRICWFKYFHFVFENVSRYFLLEICHFLI